MNRAPEMTGYLLLADGMRLKGILHGAGRTSVGWLAANTAVVGFQEMTTDPAYKGQILAFTYPEVGNVGVAKGSWESSDLQVAGLVVKVLSEYPSHYTAEGSFESLFSGKGVPCLSGIDTRGLAVHLREKGEMPAAIAPADANLERLETTLRDSGRPRYAPTEAPEVPAGSRGVKVAVLNLGIRRSQLQQLGRCCRPMIFPWDADADAILGREPAGLFVSDGPGGTLPPNKTVETLKAVVGKAPILACGLGHVALGVALGCAAEFLKRGHHGANYPVRNVLNGQVEVTQQRHTVTLRRESVAADPKVELLYENMNDGTVEGIRTPEGRAVGLQAVLAAPEPAAANRHILEFVERCT